MAVEIGAEAQTIIERLAAVDRANPVIDHNRAEAALALHMERLGVPMMPVRWLPDGRQGYLAGRSAARSAAWLAAESAARSAAESAARLATRSAAWSAARSKNEIMDRWVGIWLPFVDAMEAGLWLFWVLKKEILAVPLPALSILDNRLHCEMGPAVRWPDGDAYWFWRGIQVPEVIITNPESLTPETILSIQNAEVRRVAIERYGAAKLMEDGMGQKVHVDDWGTLWRIDLSGDEALVMVEVVNSTPEPDGEWKRYFLRVPPSMQTAKAAVLWTHDLPADAVPLAMT